MPKLTIVPVLVRPIGIARPPLAALNAYAAFREIAEFYHQQLGATFDVAPTRGSTYPMTWPQIQSQWSGKGQDFWHDMPIKAGIDMCAEQALGRAYYFVFLHPYSATFDMAGLGGMIGLERWGCPARPGTALMADQMAWLVAGWRLADLRANGWPESALPWFAVNRASALGALAHEIGHLSNAALPHPATWDDNTPMLTWWDGLKSWGRAAFTEGEKAALLASGDFA